MKILVTGAKGFIGKNLISELRNKGYRDIYEYDVDTTEPLDNFTRDCDFVFHFAGVNRPEDLNDYMKGNYGFTSLLLDSLKRNNNKAPILVTSSIQAERENPYGISKKAAEDHLFEYSKQTGVDVMVYRLPNVFGKWSRPNYNTVVATFCHNIARDMDIQINDPNIEIYLCYIDDVVNEFIKALDGNPSRDLDYCVVPVAYKVKLGTLASMIKEFRDCRKNLSIPDMSDAFTSKLYSTYLSFLSEDDFSYNLKMNCDIRGSFTEFIRTHERGQVSVNISKPGITKGNHWHHSKNEKFLVVSGDGIIRFRKVGSDDIIEYKVSGKKLQVVDIPTGYTHSIENTGECDMVTIMWANECFDPENPDTYYMEV